VSPSSVTFAWSSHEHILWRMWSSRSVLNIPLAL
jgi:hypothetical protein